MKRGRVASFEAKRPGSLETSSAFQYVWRGFLSFNALCSVLKLSIATLTPQLCEAKPRDARALTNHVAQWTAKTMCRSLTGLGC